jgi:hypothetical protein
MKVAEVRHEGQTGQIGMALRGRAVRGKIDVTIDLVQVNRPSSS